MFEFLKSAGEKVLGAIPGVGAAKSLYDHLTGKGLGDAAKNVNVEFDEVTSQVKVTGKAATRAELEKVALTLGNVAGVEKVVAEVEVESDDEKPARTYAVQKGDTLSKISKAMYGNANLYNKIFEANKPMLKSADLIYPGQVLRIPE